MSAERVIVYIDGFNLYYGIRSKRWHRYYWLNVQQLAQNLLKPGQSLVATKYFTSRVSSTSRDPNKSDRQNTYLEALGTLPDVEIYYGHYLEKTVECFTCKAKWRMPEEKMTDVNIAVEMMVDSFRDRWDTALLISGDSDLVAPITNIRRMLPEKRVVVVFPPNRHSVQLQKVAHAYFTIGRRKLAVSQFPETVRKADGFELTRPVEWSQDK
ncbi:NYN domain-containing protein [Candidatus Bipolaricaulota bacterium]|nr:NYN domain-containing protein [Candidatus Bipolaricaulota bacterium]